MFRRLSLAALFVLLAACSTKNTFKPLPLDGGIRYALTNKDTFAADYDSKIMPFFRGVRGGTFEGVDGVTIYYKAFIVPQERGAIVISNGRTESLAAYPELIWDLTRQSYSVYILDHRGQGFSERLIQDEAQKSHVDDFENYAADLHTFVTKVIGKDRHAKLYLLAHSMGGGIAARYIEKYAKEDQFTAAVLVTPMLEPAALIKGWDLTGIINAGNWVVSWMSTEGWGVGEGPYAPAPVHKNDLTHCDFRYLKLHQRYADEAAHPLLDGRATIDPRLGGVTHGWLRQAFHAASLARSEEEAKKVKIPVLIFQGSEDTAVRGPAQVEFCDHINAGQGGGSCRGYVLNGARHAVLMEDDKFRNTALAKALDFFGDPGRS